MKYRYLIGVDEVGRGPLAGPVTVGVVCLRRPAGIPSTIARQTALRALVPHRIGDSKQLTPNERETCFRWFIKARSALVGTLWYTTVSVSNTVIDERGITLAIHRAIAQALRRASAGLDPTKTLVLLDGGIRAPRRYPHQETIIHGDASEPLIGLASIVAKVTRDRAMVRWAKKFPGYGFDRHKGYGTRTHYQALQTLGPSPLHRRSFL